MAPTSRDCKIARTVALGAALYSEALRYSRTSLLASRSLSRWGSYWRNGGAARRARVSALADGAHAPVRTHTRRPLRGAARALLNLLAAGEEGFEPSIA